MTWIDLGNPTPKRKHDRHNLYLWETGEVKHLPVGMSQTTPEMLDVLQRRQTTRYFGPLKGDELGGFLWHACRSRNTWPSDLGFDLEHRAAPSAGAIHPIHLLIACPDDSRWWLYEPRGHLLIELVAAPQALHGLDTEILKVLDAPNAVRFLLVAEPGKTLAKYENGCSLVWRDAGALIGIMAVTAQALGLNFCPLGITGEPWIGSLSNQCKLVGVGVALLGSV